MFEPSLEPQSQLGCPPWPAQLKVIAVPLPPLCDKVEALVARVAVAALPLVLTLIVDGKLRVTAPVEAEAVI